MIFFYKVRKKVVYTFNSVRKEKIPHECICIVQKKLYTTVVVYMHTQDKIFSSDRLSMNILPHE